MSLTYTISAEGRVGAELLKPIDNIYPKKSVRDTPQTEVLPSADFLDMLSTEYRPVSATIDDYLQFIDKDELTEWAEKEDTVIRLEQQPGQYVVAGRPRVP